MAIGTRQFDRLIDAYQPLPFEQFPDDDRRFNRRSVHWALKNRTRLSFSVRTAARYFPAGYFTVADFGPYPGSLLRLLRRLYPPERCRLIGVGLDFSSDFRTLVPADCGAELLLSNLDPRNHRLQGKSYPTRVPLDDGSVDFVFALEVVEHLVSPTHLFAEAFRILKPGGRMLITTPNVARIGNIFKILVGRSPYERLLPVDYETEHDTLPHVREYTMDELKDVLRGAGFRVGHCRHFIGDDTQYNVKSVSRRLVDLAQLAFYGIPTLRGTLLAMGEK